MLKGVMTQHTQDSILKLQMNDLKFLKMTRAVIEPKHFTAKQTATICKLIYEYFDLYKKPPKDHFRNYLLNYLGKTDAQEADYELYAIYLDRLDEKVDANFDYMIDKVSKFARRATLREASIKFSELVAKDEFEEAETLMQDALKSGIKNVELGFNLLDKKDRLYRLEEEQYLSKFGIEALDKSLGGTERKTLVVVLAPPKGGKSWFLIHLGTQALQAGLKVVHFTHEMSERKVSERYDQMMYQLAKDTKEGKVWRDIKGGQIVTEPRTEYDTIRDVKGVHKHVDVSKRLYGGRGGWIRIKDYPTGTCTVGELERYLDYAEATEGIVPDVVISDYGDIMASEQQHSSERERVHSIYVRLREIAVSRNILVLTASQANRSAIEAPTVGVQHIAEDIRKVAIADLVLSVARTAQQQSVGQGQIRVAVSRETEPFSFEFGGNLDFGQFYTYEIPRRDDED